MSKFFTVVILLFSAFALNTYASQLERNEELHKFIEENVRLNQSAIMSVCKSKLTKSYEECSEKHFPKDVMCLVDLWRLNTQLQTFGYFDDQDSTCYRTLAKIAQRHRYQNEGDSGFYLESPDDEVCNPRWNDCNIPKLQWTK